MSDDANPQPPRDRGVRFGLSVPNFAEPARLVEIGVDAEAAGWDGVFLWDHAHGSPDMPVPTSDPWVTLGAIAVKTATVRLGTAITAPARRRPQKLARETVTLDHLSGGRLTLGVGLGEPPDEYEAYGDTADRADLAGRLDEALEVVARMWTGEPFAFHGAHYTVERAQFLPIPAQAPRIPVWASCTTPHRAPLRRAARWDGVIIATVGESGSVEATDPSWVAGAVADIAELRGPDRPRFDVVVGHPGLPDDAERERLVDAGATWILVSGWIDELDDVVAGLG